MTYHGDGNYQDADAFGNSWTATSGSLVQLDGDVAHLVIASDHHTNDAGSIPRCGKGFFFQSQLSVQTLSVSVHPRVQPHAFTSVRTLNIL